MIMSRNRDKTFEKRSKRGVSIPTAMFFVLISFLISTVMAARAHLDLQLTRYDGLEMERELAARGAAARVLVELNDDDGWKEHDSSNRVVFERVSEGARFTTEGWAEQDSDNPLIYHVFGRAFNGELDSQSSLSSRVVLRRPDVEGIVFANAPVGDRRFESDSLFVKRGYDREWELLPPAPVMTYDSDRRLHIDHSRHCGSLNNLAADNNGRVYAHYIPGYDRDDFIGDIFRDKYKNFIRTGNFSDMYRAIPDYVEALGFGLRNKAFGGSVLMRYDLAKSGWEALPAVPDVSYSGNTAILRKDRIYDGGVGPIEVSGNSLYTALYRDGRDAMLRLDLGSNEWEVIQPPNAGLPEASQAEADDRGNLYAKWHTLNRNRSAIFRLSGNSNTWQSIPMPLRGQFDSDGHWHALGGEVPDLQHMDVTPDGKVYAVWNASDMNSSWNYVIYEYGPDDKGVERWRPLPPSPGFSDHKSKNSPPGATEQAYAADDKVNFRLVKSVAVDAEGRIISSIRDRSSRNSKDPLVYQQGEEYIPLGELPELKIDGSGQVHENRDPKKKVEAFQASGGGTRNGSKDRYIPVFRY